MEYPDARVPPFGCWLLGLYSKVALPFEVVATPAPACPCHRVHPPRGIRVDIWLNLPGWRWGMIMKIPLVAVSRPLHSGVCETRQDAGLPVIHSAISDSGRLRTRGGQLRWNALWLGGLAGQAVSAG